VVGDAVEVAGRVGGEELIPAAAPDVVEGSARVRPLQGNARVLPEEVEARRLVHEVQDLAARVREHGQLERGAAQRDARHARPLDRSVYQTAPGDAHARVSRRRFLSAT